MTTDRAPGATAVPSAASLTPDPTRVVGQLFVPGHALAGEGGGRASRVVAHVLALSEADVTAAVDDLVERFGGRHRELADMFEQHARRLASRVAPDTEMSAGQRFLLGATFTQEFAVEATSVCNPSAVAAEDQRGVAPGALRFVMSTRQIGEGHRSSIGFRTGVLGHDDHLVIDPRSPFTLAGTIDDGTLDAGLFGDLGAGVDADAVRWVLDGLGTSFTSCGLRERLQELETQGDTRRDIPQTVAWFPERASRCYSVRFPASSGLDERTLSPSCPAEVNGLEDARFVRFVDDDGTVTYYATYTAYDGTAIAQQLLATSNFESFTSAPVLGAAAANKGLALFPRRINGRFYALSRHDGATNGISTSDDVRHWRVSVPLDLAHAVWNSVQMSEGGNA